MCCEILGGYSLCKIMPSLRHSEQALQWTAQFLALVSLETLASAEKLAVKDLKNCSTLLVIGIYEVR